MNQDFSLAETSSLTKLEDAETPSWINLKTLKSMVRKSQDIQDTSSACNEFDNNQRKA